MSQYVSILAIDTSTDDAGVALVREERVCVELAWSAGRNHTRHLHAILSSIPQVLGISLSDIDAVVVALGPGSFSGLRVGISAAGGFALALDIPVAGVGTLDAIAYQAGTCGGEVVAVIPAGRGRVYTGRYQVTADTIARIGDYLLETPQAAASRLKVEVTLVGPGADLVAIEAQHRGIHPSRVPWPAHLRRPAYLAELGRRSLVAGRGGDATGLEPLYLRRSAAEEMRAKGDQE